MLPMRLKEATRRDKMREAIGSFLKNLRKRLSLQLLFFFYFFILQECHSKMNKCLFSHAISFDSKYEKGVCVSLTLRIFNT